MTTVRASATLSDRASVQPRSASLAGALVPPAMAVVILAAALVLLMTPFWMHFALAASGGTAAAATPEAALQLSDRTVLELFVGPGTFSDYAPDEAGHMRDVRLVLLGFLALAVAGAAFLAWRIRRASSDPGTWRSIARGGAALAVGLVVVGVLTALFFDLAFELFHRIFFPGGNWAFAPDSLLIKLYPYAFWQLSAGAFGLLGIGGGLVVWSLARRRARKLENGSAQ